LVLLLLFLLIRKKKLPLEAAVDTFVVGFSSTAGFGDESIVDTIVVTVFAGLEGGFLEVTILVPKF